MNGDNLNNNRTSSEVIENSNLIQPNNDNIYHAIHVPRETEDSVDEQVHVYTDMVEALKVIKKHRFGRLKTFKTRSEAEEFAKNGSEEVNGYSVKVPTITITSEEKSNPSKTLKPQDLVAFRKILESGDLEAVKKHVWENSRYLIGSGDTPAILQEGCRFNALHIASSKGSKNAEMCKLILDTISDPKYIAYNYGEDQSKFYVERSKILLDLYLNTPDKGLNETPLHFATKYGLKDVVKLLVSYPQCIKTLKNKYDQTPLEIICMRKCQDDELLKKEIRMLLGEQYYVPVLRAEDSTIQPAIGLPFSPTSPPQLNIDPISPRLEVRAFAGPMTKPQALEFRKKWKTPPRTGGINNKCDNSPMIHSPSRDMDIIRFKDTEKGLERIGRNLAKEHSVSWKEFWPFLNDFADLRDSEGLAMLEKYIEEKVNRNIEVDRFLEGYQIYESADQKIPEKLLDPIDLLTKKLETFTLDESSSTNSESDDQFYTPPDTPELLSPSESDNETSDDEMFVAEDGYSYFEKLFRGDTHVAVLNAIPDVIDRDNYPFIYQWRHEMNLQKNKNSRSTRRRLIDPIPPL